MYKCLPTTISEKIIYKIFFQGEYDQNKCNGTDPTCNCPKRLPSCIGKTDGDQYFPDKRGDPAYITCFKNRTTIAQCKPGYFFEPRGKMCRPMNAGMKNV